MMTKVVSVAFQQVNMQCIALLESTEVQQMIARWWMREKTFSRLMFGEQMSSAARSRQKKNSFRTITWRSIESWLILIHTIDVDISNERIETDKKYQYDIPRGLARKRRNNNQSSSFSWLLTVDNFPCTLFKPITTAWSCSCVCVQRQFD